MLPAAAALGIFLGAAAVAAHAAPNDDEAIARRPSKETIKQQVAQILAQDKYRIEERGPAWWLRPLAAAARLLEKLLKRLFEARDTVYAAYPVLYWMVVMFLALLALGLLLHIYLSLTGMFADGRVRGRPTAVQLPPRHSPNALRAMARQAAERGEFGRAIVYLYMAILAYLDRRGLIAFSTADTNHQVLRRLAGDRDLVGRLEPLTNTVDAISYGSHAASEAELAHAEQVFDTVVAE